MFNVCLTNGNKQFLKKQQKKIIKKTSHKRAKETRTLTTLKQQVIKEVICFNIFWKKKSHCFLKAFFKERKNFLLTVYENFKNI